MLRASVWLLALIASLAMLLPSPTLHAQDAGEAPEFTADGARHVDVLRVDGPITPVVAAYIERAIQEGADDGAEAIIIRLDTPGGSVEVSQGLVQSMLASQVPVVVWVAPSGGGAISAGTFVTLAAHFAAMAPGTSIGAASPVGGEGEDIESTMRSKIENTLVTMVRGLTARRGEVAQDWAERAVRSAATLTEQEALEMGVIDCVATDLDDLLAQLDGREVTINGQFDRLDTLGATVGEIELSPMESFRDALSNPAVAYILLIVGMNGLIFEMSSPGLGAPGIIGGICLLLGLYAMGTMDANWVGFIMMILGFGLMIVEVKTPSFGLWGVSGLTSLILGSALLFRGVDTHGVGVPWGLIITNAAVTGAFLLFVVRMALKAQFRRVTTGREGMLGTHGVARSALAPEGTVALLGEIWNALAEGEPIAAGAAVEVVSVDGLTVHVRPATHEPETPGTDLHPEGRE